MNEFKKHIELPEGKDLHDTELFYIITLQPKWVKIKSNILQLNHLIANETPVACTTHYEMALNINDVIALVESPFFTEVWFYLNEKEAFVIPDKSTGERYWLEEGWYDAKLFTPYSVEA